MLPLIPVATLRAVNFLFGAATDTQYSVPCRTGSMVPCNDCCPTFIFRGGRHSTQALLQCMHMDFFFAQGWPVGELGALILHVNLPVVSLALHIKFEQDHFVVIEGVLLVFPHFLFLLAPEMSFRSVTPRLQMLHFHADTNGTESAIRKTTVVSLEHALRLECQPRRLVLRLSV